MKEEFEKWYETHPFESWGTHTVADIQAAYLAGVATGYAKGVTTMREKCAEVAEEYRDAGCITSVSGNNIAAAIRKIEVE